MTTDTNANGIAIIGMSGRFPGAGNVDEFWRNLIAGVESISHFNDEELAASGLDVAELRNNPKCVAARGIVKDAEWFDAAFFNVSPQEAEITDPQQRLFLEASWVALEDAGYDPARISGYVGVYAGMGNNSYYLNSLYSHPDLVRLVGKTAIALGNEKDFLATRVAYKLNLKGPAISINTACSTSLVAVCQACQALLCYQCDLALAGGVSVTFPQKRAYYHEGGMLSADGHCRPFDARASGTNFNDGLGVVALKRLDDALNDGDQIYAVIKGFGLNNDGAAKVGFAAPSVDGQAEVIALAQAQAGIEPVSISYIETHGTATSLGDPIEIAGLTKAFRAGTLQKGFCAIGSVKGNIGHVDAAAGVASLIKTALALKHKLLPPSLHFTEPNPKIDFANSPFFVISKLTEWKAGRTPRRAGVSAFGFGGTNAHVVLEEAPAIEPSGQTREWQLLLLSAKTDLALDSASCNLLEYFKGNADLNLADAAFTLQVGRRVCDHRRMLVCRDLGDAIKMLETGDQKRMFARRSKVRNRQVLFMFSGQGSQYVNMGVRLYHTEYVFKKEIDHCAEILLPRLGLDLRQVLFPAAERMSAAENLLNETRITQPAVFVIEYALAKLWMSWGVKPRGMIGHSEGEYVAGCLAGVFTLEAALMVVAERARLVQTQPRGAMLAVRLSENEARALLSENLSIAAVNSQSLCVVSGPFDAVAEMEARLKERKVAARQIQTSHAFHSAMMDPVLQPLTELLETVELHKPSIPYVSSVTGCWITDSEATDPKYWATHVRKTVRFGDGVGELLKVPEITLLEVGPSQTLTTLAGQHPAKADGQVIVSSFCASKEEEVPALLNALGKLWLAGAAVDWGGFYKDEKRHRVTLPTYPFERKRFWIEPASAAVAQPPPHEASADARRVSSECLRESYLEEAFEPPREEMEEKVAGIMAAVLKVPRVGRKDSFFDLGGDSILAATLFNEIDRVLGHRLPLATLFREPTVEHIAGILRNVKDRSPEWPSLVGIQPNGSKPRLFCIHGAGGNLLLYRDLTSHFPGDYALYGLQSQGLDGKSSRLGTIEEMARRYVKEVRGLQPHGPYCLAGYCLGGSIAYEMAQILYAEGNEVGLLALLDTYNFCRMEQPKFANYLQQKVRFHLSNLVRLRFSDWPNYLSKKMRTARDGELSAMWKGLTGSSRRNGTGPKEPSIEASVQEMNDLAVRRYRPRPYAGHVTVFKPKINYDFFPDPKMGWGDLVTGRLEIVELPVNPHAMLMEPSVAELARELCRRVDVLSPTVAPFSTSNAHA